MAGFDLSGYVDVAERERLLFDRYPDARIQTDLEEVRDEAGKLIAWKCKATIWRSPEDPLPVNDWAVEPVPGKTPYTKDSEAMNASTSAVGRAIVLAGFETKKIASAEEVRNRQPAESRPRIASKPENTKALNEALAALAILEDRNDWPAVAKDFCESQFHKSSVADLTNPELASLVAEMQRLRVQLEAESGPV